MSWDELLGLLTQEPRENGTAELHRAAVLLGDALRDAGAEVAFEPFTATPYVLRIAGVLILVGGVAYFGLLRTRRSAAALAVAVALPAVLLLQLDEYVPVFGWIGAETQHHVIGSLPASGTAEQRLVFAAHYDTKTDLLDHVERAPVDALAVPLIAVMWIGAGVALAGPSLHWWVARAIVNVAIAGALLYGVLGFGALSVGAFLKERSPGALDDGASCALLVRIAEALAREPLERTEVEVWLLSAEEVGVQGSWVYAERRFGSGAPELPTRVINLEGLGASGHHGVLPRESFVTRSFEPDPQLVALLARVHREELGAPLEELPFGGATDARSLLAHGIPAATVTTLEDGSPYLRGLHSARDDRSRVDEAALEASLRFLLATARAADASG